MNTPKFDLNKFRAFSLGVVTEGMSIVRDYQLGIKLPPAAEIKPGDGSLLTEIDTEVSALMRARIGQLFPGVDHNVEDDVAGPTQYGSRYKIWGDPIDGTSPFAAGASTSTVIMGVHDLKRQKVLACVIGEPATGRIWWTEEDGAFTGLVDYSSPTRIGYPRPLDVWAGPPMHGKSAVFLDNPKAFVRGPDKRPILGQAEAGTLVNSLREHRLLMLGSNGIHQALVAQGNYETVGGITSAIGGPQDVVGVRLVLNAGGSARAFAAVEGGFVEKSPEAIESYDLLVYGNNADTVDRLSSMVLSLRS